MKIKVYVLESGRPARRSADSRAPSERRSRLMGVRHRLRRILIIFMRVKKKKTHKKYAKFFVTAFKFRPPFRVLVDGALLHSASSLFPLDLKTALSELLEEKSISMLITPCVLQEVRDLRSEAFDKGQRSKIAAFDATLLTALRIKKADCSH